MAVRLKQQESTLESSTALGWLMKSSSIISSKHIDVGAPHFLQKPNTIQVKR